MPSEKSPAFSFYAKDFMLGTVRMSLAERGAYITLLAYQWDSGSIPTDPAEVGRVCGCTSAQATKIWAVVGEKFRPGADGLWRNPRLELERMRQADRRAALAANGQQGGRPRKNQQVSPGKPNGNQQVSKTKPNGNQNKSLPSPSPSPSPSPERSGRAARGPGRSGVGRTQDGGGRVAPDGRAKRAASAPLVDEQLLEKHGFGR